LGILHSAGFLLEEFEGTEEAEDYAKAIIGEAVKDWGLNYIQELLKEEVYTLAPIERLLKIKQVLTEIENDNH